MFLTHDIHAPLHVFNTLYSYTTCTYYIQSPLPVLYSNSTTCIYHTMFIHTTCTMFISYYNCWTCTELCTGQWMTLFNSVRARQGSQTCTAHTHRIRGYLDRTSLVSLHCPCAVYVTFI
jgi:hypothetical protein